MSGARATLDKPRLTEHVSPSECGDGWPKGVGRGLGPHEPGPLTFPPTWDTPCDIFRLLINDSVKGWEEKTLFSGRKR